MKFLFFLFCFSFYQAQQIVIVDSLDNSPIAFSRIYDKNRLYIADSLGKYKFDFWPNDGITVESGGYQSKYITSKSSIIKLYPKINDIENVLISPLRFKKKISLGYELSSNSIVIDKEREMAVEITNNHTKPCLVDEVIIPFRKALHNKGYLFIDFYASKDGKVGEKLNTKNYILPIYNIKSNNALKLEQKIIIEAGGSIFLAVSWIENTFSSSEVFTNKIFLFTKKKHPKSTMYVRKSNYRSWDLRPFVDFGDSKETIIPAFKLLTKCLE